MQDDDADELEIHASAKRSLMPWFDDEDALEQWAIDQLLAGAEDMRLLPDPPPSWNRIQTKHKRRASLRFVEGDGSPTDALLLFDLLPEGVTLRAAWTHPLEVGLSRHARERLNERFGPADRSAELQRHWLNATVDRALRSDSLTTEAPTCAASAPLRPGIGWVTRELAGDEVALLVAAPHREGGRWNIVTILTRSTAISPIGRLARRWKRGARLVANRIRYRSPEPVRDVATRPPRLGDVVAPQRRRRRP